MKIAGNNLVQLLNKRKKYFQIILEFPYSIN